ncbi:GGDEF domain-containing protein [Massilia sp. Mn16-1_5]|uniref:GGDEF domain-containing protein n=1 Tax=Massilia sp. Mn16-1_5 TaxID=2079199 RepID=UPI00109E9049|nr:GGDEF domain-containing protein [Massilia sp. Mn16-1_5]THC40325.1 GGDEF domain-containing protein [Massilia sp. Mn16-1_5]
MPTQQAAPAALDPPPPPGQTTRLADVFLGTDSLQRRTLQLLGLAALVTAIIVLLLVYAASIGVADVVQVAVLSSLFFVFILGFYAVIRSGLNRRFADPTLAMPQTILAQTLIAGVYAVTGPVHGATVIMLSLVMVFGMFSLRPSAVRHASVYTVILMGVVMYWCTDNLPLHYPLGQELFNFALTAIVMLAISKLSGQLSDMRTRLKTQKIALEQALGHIKEMAARDELTGLPNRRRMMTLLQEHATRHARGGPRFFVCIIDLDHFKSINDTYGHAAGDAVLRAFATQAQVVLRTTDMIGRWGGEEFLLLLPESAPGDPTLGVARLRESLASLPASPVLHDLRVQFSAGFARYEDGEPIDQAIERADRALYAAKSAGRNRSVVL